MKRFKQFISEKVESLETYTSNLNSYNNEDMLNCSDEGAIIKTINEYGARQSVVTQLANYQRC